VDADPPNIRGRPKRNGDVTDPPIPIHRGNGDSMSGGYLGQRGRPVPDAGSRPATMRLGVGPGGSRKGSYYLWCRVMPAEGRALTSGVLLRETKRGDWPWAYKHQYGSDSPEKALP
jgi:hypothetical protein